MQNLLSIALKWKKNVYCFSNLFYNFSHKSYLVANLTLTDFRLFISLSLPIGGFDYGFTEGLCKKHYVVLFDSHYLWYFVLRTGYFYVPQAVLKLMTLLPLSRELLELQAHAVMLFSVCLLLFLMWLTAAGRSYYYQLTFRYCLIQFSEYLIF